MVLGLVNHGKRSELVEKKRGGEKKKGASGLRESTRMKIEGRKILTTTKGTKVIRRDKPA